MVIAIIGIAVGFMQAVILLYLSSIKADIKDVWERMYDHTHTIKCSGKDCDVRETGGIVVPLGSKR